MIRAVNVINDRTRGSLPASTCQNPPHRTSIGTRASQVREPQIELDSGASCAAAAAGLPWAAAVVHQIGRGRPKRSSAHEVQCSIVRVLPKRLVEADGAFLDGPVLAVGRFRIAVTGESVLVGRVDGHVLPDVVATVVGVEQGVVHRVLEAVGVEEACSGEGLPSGRMIGSGAWPKRYRPPRSLRNVLTIGWKFFTSSRLKLASPPPCLVRLSLDTGLKVLNELKKPPNSMCIRLPFTFGSNASLDIGMQVSAGCRCRRPDRSACWCKEWQAGWAERSRLRRRNRRRIGRQSPGRIPRPLRRWRGTRRGTGERESTECQPGNSCPYPGYRRCRMAAERCPCGRASACSRIVHPAVPISRYSGRPNKAACGSCRCACSRPSWWPGCQKSQTLTP